MVKTNLIYSLIFLWPLLSLSQSEQNGSVDTPKIHVVLSGDYADPSILKDGSDYYMTNTSTNYLPGLRVWHSKDLSNWHPIAYALNKFVGEVWAPDFIKHRDTYYIYFPAYPGTNWVITAKSPYGPWSDPVDLKVKGIDPGHIATPDGKRYLYFNDGKVVELTADGLSLVGEPKKVYHGWDYPKEWTVECFCAESPKLHYFDGYYYLTTAQGGTSGPSTSHMVVQARSKSPLGPWENSPYNPIVRTVSSDENFWSKGHGTVVRTPSQGWALVYHAYQRDWLAHGRQVLLEPIELTSDGWYRLKRDPMREPSFVILPNLKTVSDNFNGNRIHSQWQFSEQYDLRKVRQAEGVLTLTSELDSMFVMHTQPHTPNFEIEVELEPQPGIEAGLLVYYRNDSYAGLALKDNKIIRRGTSLKYGSPSIEADGIRFLKLRIEQYDLSMAYSTDGKNWQPYPNSMNVQGYQHNMLGKFSSLKPAIYIKGKGNLTVKNFRFTPL